MSFNPWQAEGVSILPSDLSDLMPIVGQEDLFRSLTDFRAETLARGKDALSGFFVLIGGWGVGKSRVGHEVCLEAAASEAQWIIGGRPARILQEGLAEGILPLFVRYSQVTSGPLGSSLSTDSWIPTVAWESLCRLAGMRGVADSNRLTKNQSRLMDLTRKALLPRGRGWEATLPQLAAALECSPVHQAVRKALEVLQEELHIDNVWIVVDEIEDITDIERDGLPSEDRGAGIDQALMTVIPRVIKYEELRGEFPQLNFILLCSLALGDLMRGIPAISRRTRWHPHLTNAFQDVEAFFKYLHERRPAIASDLVLYPPGLKEAAFFAANRNFGWFNVIMHHAHNNHRQGALGVPGLLKKFAENPPRGLRGTVFDLDAISEYHVPHDNDYAEVERLIFGLLPRAIGPGSDQIPQEIAQRLFSKTHDVTGKHLFTRAIEAEPPAPHLITAHMVSSGFRNPEGNILELPGEARFNIQVVMDSLRAYSIGLPPERRHRLLICEDESEFTEQIRSLSPFATEAEQFAPPLHKFLMLAYDRERSKRQDGPEYIAPAFSFLRRFNRLNKLREAESGYLRDGRKNSSLQGAYNRIINDTSKLSVALLRGLAFSWEQDLIEIDFPDGFHHVCAEFSSQKLPLSIGIDSKVTLLVLSSLDEVHLRDDFNRLAREPRHPLILVVRNSAELVEQLEARVARIAPDIAPFTIIHNLGQYQSEILEHLGLMGEEFDPNEPRTSHFSGWIGTARQSLQQRAETWRRSVELQGLVLRPIFFARGAKHDEIRALALGYNAMLGGVSFDKILQSDALPQTDRDLFKKGVDRHLNPGPKYYAFHTLGLFTEESGSKLVQVPRGLISLTERCSALALPKTALEESFLYETSEDTKPRDIIQQVGLFLAYLGILEISGDKFGLVTGKSVKDSLERAEDWLKREFEQAVSTIDAVHHEVADNLKDRYAKVAKQQLKEAQREIDSLDLSFLKAKWEELNKTTSQGEPLYVARWKTAIRVIADVRTFIGRVLDAEANKAFTYTPDLLSEYETQSTQDDYALWRRVSILRGFYKDLRDRRQALEKRMQEIRNGVDPLVPEFNSQRIFPIQALTLPLDCLKQEINFPSERPNRTIQIGSTALALQTVGFKLASGKYREALDRLDQIHAELNDPGKLVSVFQEALREWGEIRKDAKVLSGRVAATLQFFSDADPNIKVRFRLKDLQEKVEELRGVAEEGLLREKTDQREAAGVQVFELAPKLAGDVQEVKPLASELRTLVDGIDNSVIVRLQEDYREKYGYILKAFQRVRAAQNKNPVMLPEKQAATWSATLASFEEVITQAREEGQAYLPSDTQTTFQEFIKLCELEDRASNENREIDWSVSPYKEHVQPLMEKKLLRLKLI